MIILVSSDRDQGSNGDKRSYSDYILKVEWREFAEGLEYERKTGIRTSLKYFGLNRISI